MTTSGPVRTAELTRSPDDRMVAGVCGGLAEHIGLSSHVVRIGMLVFTIIGGAGALFYLWLWATVPLRGETDAVVPLKRALTRPAEAPGIAEPAETSAAPAASETATVRDAQGPSPHPGGGPGTSHSAKQGKPQSQRQSQRHLTWPVAELLLGATLLLVGLLLVLWRFLGVELRLSLILPALAVLVGVGLTWWQVADRHRPDRNQVPRVLGALALVAVGVLMFFVTSEEPSMWTVVAAALAVLAGVALAAAPWVLRVNRELMAERAARARETERSEIAAHLHDSVLQTLALIQQRSEPGSDVARIARSQERELREWLFRAADGAPPVPRETVGEELRRHAAALEHEHSVRFETVGVGAEAIVPEAIVAAAKEAMLNAARHAGGDVTVFAEVMPDRVSIDITDRGAGLDLADIPEGRMGVRESILGRMARAGGSAKIVPGPGGRGTAVRLEMSLSQAPVDGGEQIHEGEQ